MKLFVSLAARCSGNACHIKSLNTIRVKVRSGHSPELITMSQPIGPRIFPARPTETIGAARSIR